VAKSVEMRRTAFNGAVAEALAASIGVPHRLEEKVPRRFAFFGDTDRLVVIAGEQEDAHVQLALVYGLSLRGHRDLTLVLPAGHSNATEQRIPWLK
jgi:hypothetical protein